MSLLLTFRRRFVAPLLLGSHDVVAEPDRLILRHSPRSGCLGIIALLWLAAWCFGLVGMARGALHAGKTDPSAIIEIAVTAAVIIASALYAVYQFTALDELRVDVGGGGGGGGITYRRRVASIIVLRRWNAPLDAVKNIDLVERRPPRRVGFSSGLPQPYALLVSTEGDRPPLSYGDDAGSFFLVRWARALRERVEQLRGLALPPAPVLDQAAEQVAARDERAIRAGLDAVGAATAADLKDDPKRRRQAMRRAIEQQVHDAIADERPPPPPRTRPRQPNPPPETPETGHH